MPALKIRNSWGTARGEKGYGWLPYEYVEAGLAGDFWRLLKQEHVNTGKFDYPRQPRNSSGELLKNRKRPPPVGGGLFRRNGESASGGVVELSINFPPELLDSAKSWVHLNRLSQQLNYVPSANGYAVHYILQQRFRDLLE